MSGWMDEYNSHIPFTAASHRMPGKFTAALNPRLFLPKNPKHNCGLGT